MRSTVDILIASTLSAVLAIGLYAFAIGSRVEAAYIPVPRGSILYFNATTCPTGWTEFTAARGAYIVGLQSGGTLASVVGTALTNLENRPTGQHAHTATGTATENLDPGTSGTAAAGSEGRGLTTGAPFNVGLSLAITVNNSAGTSGVAGTNAPYLQLLVCAKS